MIVVISVIIFSIPIWAQIGLDKARWAQTGPGRLGQAQIGVRRTPSRLYFFLGGWDRGEGKWEILPPPSSPPPSPPNRAADWNGLEWIRLDWMENQFNNFIQGQKTIQQISSRVNKRSMISSRVKQPFNNFIQGQKNVQQKSSRNNFTPPATGPSP
jgi:hypothetical protein